MKRRIPMRERMEDLVSRMSLAEKLGQLTMTTAGHTVTGPVLAGDSTQAIKDGTVGNLLNLVGADRVRHLQRLAVEESRLGIPLLIGFDVIHGHRTLFPIPLGEAATFDPAMWAMTARESAKEAAADGIGMTFAPMLDVARDPRWGRGAEGAGEDPWLGARMAEAKVRGFQGADLAAPDALAAVAKHFCAYGASTAGRDYASADISERSVHEVHLPAFAAAVAAGVCGIMPAFTDLAGVPMTANGALLRGWLREKSGFEGVIVSDYHAIAELIPHGVAADLAEAASLALKAGVDIDMMSDAYRLGLPVALERGWVTHADVDRAVHRVLQLKERLGLFDDPYRRGATPESDSIVAARRQLARRAGSSAIVMLKNSGVLPLARDGLRLAVVGPLADAGAEMRGPWYGAASPEGHVTVVAGLRTLLSDSRVLYAAGVAIDGTALEGGAPAAGAQDGTAPGGVAAALAVCETADVIVLCVGEAAAMSGEAASRAHVGLPGRQGEFSDAIFECARRLRKPVVTVLFSGRPLVVPELAEQSDALLAAWFLGSESGHAIGDVLCGTVSPGGRSPVSWPRAAGQIPIFFGYRPTGRPADFNDHFTSKYLDVVNEPLFPFGHGLNYGRFAYSNLRVPRDTVSVEDTIVVCVDLLNDGSRTAEETVFLFTHDKVASVVRPVLELKAFGKISLNPGEAGIVTLSLPASELHFLGLNLEPVFEPGAVEILVGPSADRARLLVKEIYLVA